MCKDIDVFSDLINSIYWVKTSRENLLLDGYVFICFKRQQQNSIKNKSQAHDIITLRKTIIQGTFCSIKKYFIIFFS